MVASNITSSGKKPFEGSESNFLAKIAVFHVLLSYSLVVLWKGRFDLN